MSYRVAFEVMKKIEVTERGGITRYAIIKQDCENAKKITKTLERIWQTEDKFKPYANQIIKGQMSEEAKALGIIILQQKEERNLYQRKCSSSHCLEDCDYRKISTGEVMIGRVGHRSKRQDKNVEEALRKKFRNE
jgi:hypothetical protein